MNTPFRVSMVQLAVRDGEPATNVARATELITGAPAADLYVLPELWTTGYAQDSWADAAEQSTPAALQALGAVARRTNAMIAGSTVARNERGDLVNRLSLLGPDGTVVAAYDKAHLFAPMQESQFLTAGTQRVRARVGPFIAGLSICYDLRFPEMYRLDALAGANLFLVVAAWPASRVGVMGVLAAARAIENQAFLVLCNRTGAGADATEFGGESRIVGPDGTVVARAGVEETTLAGCLSADVVRGVRGESPLIGLRVPGVDWPG